ncbi:hypothetical protein PROPEN_01589 [Proteus penneri ATCC 35198]|nr:hypothetical protein PROPEN_01589 [Proteus penneri ATCC 35198]
MLFHIYIKATRYFIPSYISKKIKIKWLNKLLNLLLYGKP